ncbi:MAG TPA: hypothetical protein VMV49_14775 [Candidatus Deferrimicrobium sp.]|nr:hypothetical protein [Candidatus Deferrimicrobium sp.]
MANRPDSKGKGTQGLPMGFTPTHLARRTIGGGTLCDASRGGKRGFGVVQRLETPPPHPLDPRYPTKRGGKVRFDRYREIPLGADCQALAKHGV